MPRSMAARERPDSSGASPIFPRTLLARIILARRPLRVFPTIPSEAPLLYTFAVSKKFTPASMHRSIMRNAAGSSTCEPNVIVPKQARDTGRSVCKRVRVCIVPEGLSSQKSGHPRLRLKNRGWGDSLILFETVNQPVDNGSADLQGEQLLVAAGDSKWGGTVRDHCIYVRYW